MTAADLVSKHRELNKLSGAKGHQATKCIKQRKLSIKTEIKKRADAGDMECHEYLNRSDEPPVALVEPEQPRPRLDGGAVAEFPQELIAAE